MKHLYMMDKGLYFGLMNLGVNEEAAYQFSWTWTGSRETLRLFLKSEGINFSEEDIQDLTKFRI